MVKSVSRGNAGPYAPAGGSGAMPGMTGDGENVLAGPAGGPDPARVPLRRLMDDRLLDALLDRSRDQAGGLRLTGEARCSASWSRRCWNGHLRPG
jgi:hypothetical protein